MFAASDEAYAISGKPSLSLLHFHISPIMMTVLTLKTMSVRTKMPTLSNHHFLMVTSVRREISINLVKVNVPPVYESVSVIVYGVNRFFDLSFDFDAPIPTPNNTDDLGCSSPFADYVVPCKLTGRDLFGFKGKTILPTLSKNPRFTMIVEQLDKIIIVNALPVYLDMYSNEMLTVHGLLLSLDSYNIRSGTPDEILRWAG